MPTPSNTIVRRAFSTSGKWYFRMADNSLIKPETAIKRGLTTREAIDQALREEAEHKAALQVKPALKALLESAAPKE